MMMACAIWLLAVPVVIASLEGMIGRMPASIRILCGFSVVIGLALGTISLALKLTDLSLLYMP
jgi:hypothetical protein